MQQITISIVKSAIYLYNSPRKDSECVTKTFEEIAEKITSPEKRAKLAASIWRARQDRAAFEGSGMSTVGKAFFRLFYPKKL